MNEKTTILLGILGALLVGVIAPAIAWYLGANTLQPLHREILRRFLNLEITLLLIGLVPILTPFVLIANVIFVVIAFMAVNNGTEFKSIGYNFIK